MNKITRSLTLFSFTLAVLLLSFQSCKKEEFQTREVIYQLSGTFGKSLTVKYTPTEGTIATAEEVINLPWQKAVIPNAENASVGLIVVGRGGIPGATVTAKILVNGQVAKLVDTQVGANGDLAININHLF